MINMAQISVKNLTFSYDTVYDNIFDQVYFQIDSDWKLGFVGRNGRGKTTFLNLLMGKYNYQGTIQSPLSFEYFPYLIEDMEQAALSITKEMIAPYNQWEEEMEQCLAKYGVDGDQGWMDRYGELQELYQAHDGYQIDDLIQKEVAKLAVEKEVLSQVFSTLSFGERTKLMLAALFLKKNHFLLIDEPTNHLDREGREILANYLQSKSGFILVSHDRRFLDQSVDHILSINRANIEVVKGNFTSWYENKELQDQYEQDQNENLKKDIANLEVSMKRMAGWAHDIESTKIGSHEYDRGFIGHKSAKMMKRAKSVEHRLQDAIDEKKGLLKNIETADALRMNPLEFHKKTVIKVENLRAFYGEREILHGIDLQLDQGDRIAIEGKNGSGKSTLFKLLLGEEIRYTGDYRIATGLKISYVSQDTSYLTGNLKDFAYRYGIDETIFKTVLRQLDFSRLQFEKSIDEFSEGQKKKVLLAKSLSESAHVYLWDEPLNFIDVLSRIQMEELILQYQPTMIFIEHDQVFSDKITTKIIRL